MMRRAQKPVALTAGGIITMNMQAVVSVKSLNQGYVMMSNICFYHDYFSDFECLVFVFYYHENHKETSLGKRKVIGVVYMKHSSFLAKTSI